MPYRNPVDRRPRSIRSSVEKPWRPAMTRAKGHFDGAISREWDADGLTTARL
jgi:hypothetical protein